jgi:uncharacterized protein (TIRG00374 family)
VLKRAAIALLLSLTFSLAGLYLVVGEAVFRPETYRAQNFGVPLVVLLAVVFLAKWFSPAVRVGLLCRGQKIALPYRSAVLVHLVAMFAAALAPQNTGFGPATVAALYRLGVPIGRGIGVAVQVMVLDLIFFAWAVPVSIGYLIYSDTLDLPPGTGVVAFATGCLAIGAAVALSRRPQLIVGLAFAVARWRLMARFATRLRKIARDYYRSAKAFLRMPASDWLTLHLATAAGWFSGFVLLWLLLKLYGVDPGLLATLTILSSITLVSHFVPTPGAAGFMEAAVGLSISANPGGDVAAALLVWRLASFYVVYLLGPPAGWLLYQSRPAASPVAATGDASTAPRRREPL